MGSGCFSCTKYLFVFLNIIFLVFGIFGIAAGVYLLLDPTLCFKYTQKPGDATLSIINLLIAGILLFLAAILGIWGTLKERRWGIIVCFCLLLIIVVAEVSAGIWGYIHRESLDAHVRLAIKETVEREYREDNNVRKYFDTFQEKLECCGAEKATDWMNTGEINIGVTNSKNTFSIPKSCCRQNLKAGQCLTATENLKIGSQIDYNVVYDKGCYPLVMEKLKAAVNIIMLVGFFILGIQVLGLILALCLAFSINRSNRYKA